MAETPTTRVPSEEEVRQHGYRRAAEFLLSLYRQVAAVLAAFGLAAIITDVWDVDWRGVLETAVGFWTSAVRPVMTLVFQYAVTAPLGWVGVDFEVPLWIRDYIAIGLILGFSMHRDYRASREVRRDLLFVDLFESRLGRAAFMAVGWPLYLALIIPAQFSTFSRRRLTLNLISLAGVLLLLFGFFLDGEGTANIGEPASAEIWNIALAGLVCSVLPPLLTLLFWRPLEGTRWSAALRVWLVVSALLVGVLLPVILIMLFPSLGAVVKTGALIASLLIFGSLLAITTAVAFRTPEGRQEVKATVRILAPVLYLGILFLLNSFLMP